MSPQDRDRYSMFRKTAEEGLREVRTRLDCCRRKLKVLLKVAKEKEVATPEHQALLDLDRNLRDVKKSAHINLPQ